jgi:hypothetical protein
MSSLIFFTDAEQALVATDTLATSPDGQPLMFTTKAFVLPHLRMVIAGTGAGRFLGKWFIQLNDRIAVKDIDNLNYHAPQTLTTLWVELLDELPGLAGTTTTVYHFGFSETDGQIHTFAYRSASEFRSEAIPYGLGVKPAFAVPEEYQLPRDLKGMMDAQREVQMAKPHGERVYIGGEITVNHLTKHGFAAYTLDRFADYAADESVIYRNIAAQKKKAVQ